jgi:hypothetical protein
MSWAQLTAFFTRAAIFFSSAAVSFVSAKEVGHMLPSSRFACLQLLGALLHRGSFLGRESLGLPLGLGGALGGLLRGVTWAHGTSP